MIEYLVINPKNRPEKKETGDLKQLHEIRGRLLHVTSVIEKIMKEYCGKGSDKKTFGPLKDEFIGLLTTKKLNDTADFNEFVNALRDINPDRNNWAHGLVSYEKREKDGSANNSITLNTKVELIRHPYFEGVNKKFDVVINWLKKNDLWKINGYEIVEG